MGEGCFCRHDAPETVCFARQEIALRQRIPGVDERQLLRAEEVNAQGLGDA